MYNFFIIYDLDDEDYTDVSDDETESSSIDLKPFGSMFLQNYFLNFYIHKLSYLNYSPRQFLF